jgi:hypothetical protein
MQTIILQPGKIHVLKLGPTSTNFKCFLTWEPVQTFVIVNNETILLTYPLAVQQYLALTA